MPPPPALPLPQRSWKLHFPDGTGTRWQNLHKSGPSRDHKKEKHPPLIFLPIPSPQWVGLTMMC